MRQGILTLKTNKTHDWGYLIAVCDLCYTKHRGCDGCPDLKDCRAKWDRKADFRG
jgi:hypothetical protein